MPHGFMNFDFPQGMPEATIVVNETVDILKDLLHPKLKNKIEDGIMRILS
jgi:hypothetical protein